MGAAGLTLVASAIALAVSIYCLWKQHADHAALARLLSAFRMGHGDRCPEPGTAVVTPSPVPALTGGEEAAPALARQVSNLDSGPQSVDLGAGDKEAIRARVEAEEDEREKKRRRNAAALEAAARAVATVDGVEVEARETQPVAPAVRLVTGNMTPEECAVSRFHDLLRDAGVAADHCSGSTCEGGGSSVCACDCATCSRRRPLYSQAQRDVGMSVSRMPGESAEAWALRSVRASQAPARRDSLPPPVPKPADEDGDRDSDATCVFTAGDRATMFGDPPTLASEGVSPEVPPESAQRRVALERLAAMSAAQVADIDRRAAEQGTTREEILYEALGRGLPSQEDKLNPPPPSSGPRRA